MTEKNHPSLPWLERRISPALAMACVAVMLLGYAIGQIASYIYDSDMYFLVATGRELVETGKILRENPWAIDQGLAIVVQQWLYCVLVYFAEQGGYAGLIAFVVAENLACWAVAWALFRLDGVKPGYFLATLAVSVALCTRYQFSDRPECMTVILLLLECYGIERAARSGEKAWLALLPLSTFLEANMHSSMWFVHYCVLLAYVVPAIAVKPMDDSVCRGLIREWKALLAAVAASAAMLFVNPYGAKGVTYLFDAFAAATFQTASISEQEPALFLGTVALTIAILAAGCAACMLRWRGKGILRSQSLYFTLGFSFMAAFAVKNAMFLILPLLLVGRDLCRGVSQDEAILSWLPALGKNKALPVLVLCTALFAWFPYARIEARFMSGSTGSGLDELEQVAEYIYDHGDAESRVFAGFNTGAYFEYRGFRNVYMDARPELFTKKFNGKRVILAEYTEYCMDGYMLGLGDIAVRQERIDEWFDGYDFDYVVVHPGSERILCGYMLNKEGYRWVDDFKFSSVLLYEKEAIGDEG